MINKYQYTRTIAFGADIQTGNFAKIKKLSFEEIKDLLGDLLDKLQFLQVSYNKYIFFENNQGEKRVTKYMELKKPFLREYASGYLYAGNNVNAKNVTADRVERYSRLFSQKAESLSDIVAELEYMLEMFDESPGVAQGDAVRKSSVGKYIKSLVKKDALPFFELLSQMGKNTKKGDVEDDYRIAVEDTKRVLSKLLPATASSGSGIEIARASLNYFTVDKNAVKFSQKSIDDLLIEVRDELYNNKKPLSIWINNKQLVQDAGLKDHLDNKGLSKLSLEELYQEMKTYKAKAKSNLNELVSKYVAQGAGGKELFVREVLQIPLFSNEGVLKKFFDRKLEISELNKNYQKTNDDRLKKELDNLRRNTGNFFRIKNKKEAFNTYVSYCNDLYKPIAAKRGRVKAKLVQLSLEQEEARLLKYWALFYENNGIGRGVILMPKEKRQEARAFLKQKMANSGTTCTVSEVLSLTAKAIRKRIQQDYPRRTPDLYDEKHEQKRIKLLKDVLSSKGESRSVVYEIPQEITKDIEEIIKKNHSTLEEFREDLEKVFYVLKGYAFDNEDDIQAFVDKFDGVFVTIAGYDFERDVLGEEKEFTKLWGQYWSDANKHNHYGLRINPELRIFIRPKQEGYHKESRHSKDTVHLHFSITDNAGSKEFIPPLVHEREVEKYIDKFNEDVIDPWVDDLDNKNELWYYGIDRGNQELATLGLVKWSKDEYYKAIVNNKAQRHKKPDFAKVDVYVPKDLFAVKEVYTSKKAENEGDKKKIDFYKNPSLFLKTDEDFEKYTTKTQVSFIDLTTAKLINGKIVLFGDVSSYLKLRLLNASRKVFSERLKIKASAEIEFLDDKNMFALKNKDSERSPHTLLCYTFPKVWAQDIGDENLQNLHLLLKEELEKIWTNHKSKTLQDMSIDKINALRNTITANIVGIIKHLFQQYPGVINMENLAKSSHADKNAENIERQLEWGLYRAFQKLGIVPPRIRSKLFLQKNMKEKRFGVIHFVPKEGTSSNCPRCFVKAESNKREADKWGEHAFECTNPSCEFSTKDKSSCFEFEPVKNSDDVAACNIANPDFNNLNIKTK